MTRCFTYEHVLESNILKKICDMLRTADPEKGDYIRELVKYIASCVTDFEPMSDGESEFHYQLCSSMAQDLKIFVDAAIKRNDKELVCSIVYILATLSVKMFDTYINSDYVCL
ncbi:hypothetical protein RF11_06719 [Thelohanellus kitauei]|uniref:Uncharacterized protein n=1 Tax=Thelohanellus kitauei TaxID=669202 RepID=A0A0C2IS50_THEKT|nr:hypothetical protein RF11_06719 [Thelohanellus kitauei]